MSRTTTPPPSPRVCTGVATTVVHNVQEKAERSSGTASKAPRNRRQIFVTWLVVGLWFTFNISLSTLTKWIFLYGVICSEDGECVHYKFPLTITVVHMLFSWCACRLHIALGPPRGPWLSVAQQLRKVVPLAACFALSVAMGNLSLKYIYPSFNQMLGSMSPLITVALSASLMRTRYNHWTWASMPIICGGLALCSAKEVHFHLLGGFFAFGATFLRAAKSLIQGRLLDKSQKLDSVMLLCYMAPWAALLLSVAALVLEGTEPCLLLWRGLMAVPATDGTAATPAGKSGVLRLVGLLTLSGLVACLLNITNFLVTVHTSAVTLQVLGNVKSCVFIGISVAVFRNPLLPSQAVGVVVCLVGVGIYNRWGGPISTGSRTTTAATHAKAQ